MRALKLLVIATLITILPLPALAAPDRLANPAFPPAPPAGQAISVQDTMYGVLRIHRTLRGMQENREVLKHELDRAYRGFGPRVDVNAQGGFGILSDSTTRRNDSDTGLFPAVNLSATLTQPIWDGFATRSRVRQARSTLDSQNWRVLDNVSSLCLDGIIAHINLLRTRTLVELAEENVRVHERILGLAGDRVNVGADTQADFTQAQSRYQRALSSLEEQKDALRVAEDTYTRLTGLPAASRLQPVPMPPEIFKNSAKVFEQAEQFNPTLAAYMEDVRTATAGRELTESAFYPSFSLTAGPNYYTRGDRDDYDDTWTWSFDVMLTMTWNIFNSGADVAAYKADSARIRQARQVYYNYIDDLKLDIDSTYSNYLAAQQQYKHYSKAIEYNKYTLNAYNEQFLIGRRTLLDVLDSENELYNSSCSAETNRGNIIIGAYRLLATLTIARSSKWAGSTRSTHSKAKHIQGRGRQLRVLCPLGFPQSARSRVRCGMLPGSQRPQAPWHSQVPMFLPKACAISPRGQTFIRHPSAETKPFWLWPPCPRVCAMSQTLRCFGAVTWACGQEFSLFPLKLAQNFLSLVFSL